LAKRPPFEATHVDHLVILVDDLGAAERFYVETIGCRIAAHIAHLAMTELKAGSFSIDLVNIACREGTWARPDVRGGKNVDHFCVAIHGCTEVEVREHLFACHVEIESERHEQTDAGDELSLHIRDPSGN
jgi:glyoxylase I family protein